MNITATRFATKIRTWLLLAALTGLLIAIGGALGGAALYVFVALAVLMNVVGYRYKILEAIKPRPVIPATADPNPRDYRIRRYQNGCAGRPAMQRSPGSVTAGTHRRPAHLKQQEMTGSATLVCPKWRGEIRSYERNGILVDSARSAAGSSLTAANSNDCWTQNPDRHQTTTIATGASKSIIGTSTRASGAAGPAPSSRICSGRRLVSIDPQSGAIT